MKGTNIILIISIITASFVAKGQYSFLGGGAKLNDNCVELTPDLNNQKGWAFALEKFDLDKQDTLKFKIFVGNKDGGADGLAFILHNDPRGLAAEGCVGEALGYATHPTGVNSAACGYGTRWGITPSIAIEFDTYRNSSQGDPSNDHVAYLENGSVNHGSNYYDAGNIEDNQEHDFMFVWNPNRERIHVYLDGIRIINIRRRNLKRDIFNNENLLYWGFSASTGGARNQHYFCTPESADTLDFYQNSTVKSGDHNDPSVWLFGTPTGSQDALINASHIVTMKSAFSVSSMVINTDGKLDLNNNTLNIEKGILFSRGDILPNGGKISMNGTQKQEINLKNAQVLQDLTINNSAGVDVAGLGIVQIDGTLDILKGQFCTKDQIILRSNSTNHSGRIGELKSGASICGKVTMQRYIYSSQRLWRYLSTPMSNSVLADWQDDLPITGTFENPSSGTGIKSQSPSMYIYNEAVSGDKNDGYVAWPASGNSNSIALQVGKGYATYERDDVGRPLQMDVTGNINFGNINLPVTYTSTSTTDNDGWNLVGNPYPSQIDWSKVSAIQRSRIDNAIYFIDNNSTSTIKRSFVNGVGNPSGTNGIISPFQGFWVKANGSNPSLQLEEADKSNGNFNFYRDEIIDNVLRIKVSQGSAFDETVLRLVDGAATSFEEEVDALKMNQSSFMISSIASDGTPLSINAINSPDRGQSIVPLTFQNLKTSGSHQLTFFNLESIVAGVTFYLVDFEAGVVQNIIEDPEYTFYTNGKTTIENRFSIIVNNDQLITGTDDIEISLLSGLSIYPNPSSDKKINLTWNPSEKDVQIVVSTIDGITVHTTSESFNNTLEMNLDHLNSGTYLVTVYGEVNTYTQKVILY